MKVLITGGSTDVPIDDVRLISNKYNGRTGTYMAKYFADMEHQVTLLTSDRTITQDDEICGIQTIPFRTFDQLLEKMEELIRTENFDAIIHSTAVSDFMCEGTYIKGDDSQLIRLEEKGKISSGHNELFLRLVPTIKIVDQIRSAWGFKGILVKFKLTAKKTDEELFKIAIDSRDFSGADLIIANHNESCDKHAFIIGKDNVPEKVSRTNLPAGILRRIV